MGSDPVPLVTGTRKTTRVSPKKQVSKVVPVADDEEWFFEEILDRKPGKKGQYRYLVRWAGYGSDQDSWITKDIAGDDNALEMIRAFDSKCDQEAGLFEEAANLDAFPQDPWADFAMDR